jgi:tRNA-dihydrouridine synthase A
MKKEISIAPMVDISTVYFRQLMRILSRNTKIYTEMLSASGISRENFDLKSLYIHNNEHPIVAQLGGSNPSSLSHSAQILESLGYSEINLNCGCPSGKVKEGSFGACLMLNPESVFQLCSEMKRKLSIPLTVKCRLGVDDRDSYEELFEFIDTVKKSGVDEFVIHARKAYLNGLSPAENRTVPPLNYSWVYDLQRDFPSTRFHINGGIV